ncbi:MAG: hypothetical protein E5Y61_00095 [Mesorhizobium sp.]|nr:MAG: hypothetical protein E5Y61_00095 [Mesorhizobium sp.]TIM81138.1 MAG: hypothetical protein E5Y60_00295 [Mesorhizobium sp.]
MGGAVASLEATKSRNHHASTHHHSANALEDDREDFQSARIAQCFGTRKPSVEAPAGRSGGDGSAL